MRNEEIYEREKKNMHIFAEETWCLGVSKQRLLSSKGALPPTLMT